jgi:hypothetical protein
MTNIAKYKKSLLLVVGLVVFATAAFGASERRKPYSPSEEAAPYSITDADAIRAFLIDFKAATEAPKIFWQNVSSWEKEKGFFFGVEVPIRQYFFDLRKGHQTEPRMLGTWTRSNTPANSAYSTTPNIPVLFGYYAVDGLYNVINHNGPGLLAKSRIMGQIEFRVHPTNPNRILYVVSIRDGSTCNMGEGFEAYREICWVGIIDKSVETQ